MKQYLDLMRYVKNFGGVKMDRTGTGTKSIFGHQMRFNLQDGFPLVTTKKIHMKSVIHELIWLLAGDTNIRYLNDNGVHIWDEWADAQGNLGPIYGSQWRSWTDADGFGIDQIAQVVDQIKNNPDSRRIVVSAWNVADLPDMKLAPCHALFQFYVADMTAEERYQIWDKQIDNSIKKGDRWERDNAYWVNYKESTANGIDTEGHRGSLMADLDTYGIPRKKLSCQLYQRSADIFLGVPFNIASYALLTHMLAQQADMAVGDFIWSGGDCHLYSNHTEQVDLQLSRTTRALPQLKLNKAASIFDYKFEDFEIVGYEPWPGIKAPVAV